MSINGLFDWEQDIPFCPSPPPYVNPLPLWLRTRYPVLPLSSSLCQSIASLIEDKISSSAPLLHLMSIHCLFDWGQDIPFCPSPPPYVNPLPLWLRIRYLSIASLIEDKISSSAPLLHPKSIYCFSSEDKISSSAPLLHPKSIHCHFDWGQDNKFSPFLHHKCSM